MFCFWHGGGAHRTWVVCLCYLLEGRCESKIECAEWTMVRPGWRVQPLRTLNSICLNVGRHLVWMDIFHPPHRLDTWMGWNDMASVVEMKTYDIIYRMIHPSVIVKWMVRELWTLTVLSCNLIPSIIVKGHGNCGSRNEIWAYFSLYHYIVQSLKQHSLRVGLWIYFEQGSRTMTSCSSSFSKWSCCSQVNYH